MIGQGATPDAVGLQTPRIAMVTPPRMFRSLDGETVPPEDFDIATRMLSMGKAHRAIPGTGGLNLGVAARIPGTVPNRLARPVDAQGEVRVANPSGVVSVGAVLRADATGWIAESAVLFRTARLLMRGGVAVPEALR
jgi:2-methylaconitate cis-trans-isomerase PrpF